MRPVFAYVARLWRRNIELSLGVIVVALIVSVVLLPALYTHASPYAIDTSLSFQSPSGDHWFGTDNVGRDVYARAIYGARATLGAVTGALLISAVVGGILGLIAGFVGKAPDMVGGRAVDVVLSFPPLVLGVMITGILGPGVRNLVLALSIVYVPTFYRIARAGAISELKKTYVEAARALGVSEPVVLARHVAPNVVPLVLLQYTILFPLVLQIEAALGFLGLGVQPPTPDWGAALNEGKDFLLRAPWMSTFPGLFILISALGVILLGRGLQRIIDVR
jgi:peptide/nickel transport system permease protein